MRAILNIHPLLALSLLAQVSDIANGAVPCGDPKCGVCPPVNSTGQVAAEEGATIKAHEAQTGQSTNADQNTGAQGYSTDAELEQRKRNTLLARLEIDRFVVKQLDGAIRANQHLLVDLQHNPGADLNAIDQASRRIEHAELLQTLLGTRINLNEAALA